MPLRKRTSVIPIDTSQAQRTSGRTGVGTPGTGIGRDGDPSPALGRSRATPAVAVLAIDGKDARIHEKTGTLMADMDSARVANRRTGTVFDGRKDPVDCVTANSVQHYEVKTAQAGHLLVDGPPMAPCGCCPADPKPDSARYRACGNAVTVPVIEWIGQRLLASDY